VREKLDEERILRAFRRLSELLKERGVQGELCILGGTVMVLCFKQRADTKDVDAIFWPAPTIRELAEVVRQEQDLPQGWLNDSAKGYVSRRHEVVAGDLPQFENLRLLAPAPEYMLAMKCMASRIAPQTESQGDVADIRFLARHLGLKTPEEVLRIVAAYYPEERIPPRARFLIEDIFAETGPP